MNDVINHLSQHITMNSQESVDFTFIDLFAGIGGIRLGLEQAIKDAGYNSACVFTSEIKPHAISILKQNHPKDVINGDITKELPEKLPSFDILCAGFPCQAFSAAGNRDGFADTRGTMFFYVEAILREKKPKAFILENVEGLVNHDGGNTLRVIIHNLEEAGYSTNYKVLNSKDFGVPQERKRIYIVGYYVGKKHVKTAPKIELEGFEIKNSCVEQVLENNQPKSDKKFVKKLLEHYSIPELYGKNIKDKRGGTSNIHSWDIEIKGPVSRRQKDLLNKLMTERRKKQWAEIIGIDWMDGMPLTTQQISSFWTDKHLQADLNDLTKKGYLRFEHPKKKIVEFHIVNGKRVSTSRRVYDETKPMGYNIVTGKLSFEVSEILDPRGIAPTLVATDMQHIYVGDGDGLRRLTLREGLRLFGYPDNYKFDIQESDGYDLLGNTVVVPVIKAVAARIIEKISKT